MHQATKHMLVLLILLSCISMQSQNIIQQKVQENNTEILNTELFHIFTEVNNTNLNNKISSSVLTDKQFLRIRQYSLKSIQDNQSEHLRLNLVIEGKKTELQLFKTNLFTDDFKAVASANQRIAVDNGVHYWGTVKNDPNSLVSISFFNDEIIGSIHSSEGTFTIGRFENSNFHILYRNSDLQFQRSSTCMTGDEAFNRDINPNINADVQQSVANNCVRLHIEVDYQVYLDKGSSISATTNYVNGLFSQVAILYANESINISLSYLNIWNQASPYTSGNEANDLTAQNYGTTYGDLVHLLHKNDLTGFAWVNVLCWATYNTGVSGITGTYNSVPTFSGDVYLVAHEIGHNLGSPHTHACAWNGNNTAIDGCGPAIGNNEGCNAPLPTSGTIMSYCNLVQGVGVDFTLGFGQQPGDLIRDKVANAACLAACSPASCSTMDLDIQFDAFPTQTSWEIMDDNNNIIASSSNYGSFAGNTTTTENLCLPDGCYTLNFSDLMNNGMCPERAVPYNTVVYNPAGSVNVFGSIVATIGSVVTPGLCGNYKLKDSNGNTLVSGGGNFGGQQSNPFCISNGVAARMENTESDLLDEKDIVNVYPTMASNFVNLKFDFDSETNINLIIYDINGRMVKQYLNYEIYDDYMQLDISDLNRGSYFIRINSYQLNITKRFIKE